MRVQVKVTLDIDVDAWMLEYGCDRDEVRRDVQQHTAESIRQHLDALGLLREYEAE